MPARFKPKPERVLIFGSTGMVGKWVTLALCRASKELGLKRLAVFTAKTTVLNQARFIQAIINMDADVMAGDILNDGDIRRAYNSKAGFDTIISCLGDDLLLRQEGLAKLANQCDHIVRFIPSEFAVDIENYPCSTGMPPQRKKLRVRKYLQDQCPNLEYTFLTCGAIAEHFTYPEKYEYCGTIDLKKRETVNFGDQDKPISFVTFPDIGNFMVGCLQRFMYTGFRTLYVQSFVATQKQITDEYRRQINKPTGYWKVFNLEFEDYINHEKEQYQLERPVAKEFSRRISAYRNGAPNKIDNELIGFKPGSTTTLAKVIADQVKNYREPPW